MTSRLFIALDFPDHIINDLIEIRDKLSNGFTCPNWEPQNKFHLTLKFLGEIDELLNSKIFKIIKSKKNILKNNFFKFQKFGLFYRGNSPSILWAGGEYSKSIAKIYYEFNEEFAHLGIAKEKKRFNPHLTLLRIKNYKEYALFDKFTNYKLKFEPIEFTKITLYKSILEKNGSNYIKINEINIKE